MQRFDFFLFTSEMGEINKIQKSEIPNRTLLVNSSKSMQQVSIQKLQRKKNGEPKKVSAGCRRAGSVPCVVRGVRGAERQEPTRAAARGQRARSTAGAGRRAPGAARAPRRARR